MSFHSKRGNKAQTNQHDDVSFMNTLEEDDTLLRNSDDLITRSFMDNYVQNIPPPIIPMLQFDTDPQLIVWVQNKRDQMVVDNKGPIRLRQDLNAKSTRLHMILMKLHSYYRRAIIAQAEVECVKFLMQETYACQDQLDTFRHDRRQSKLEFRRSAASNAPSRLESMKPTMRTPLNSRASSRPSSTGLSSTGLSSIHRDSPAPSFNSSINSNSPPNAASPPNVPSPPNAPSSPSSAFNNLNIGTSNSFNVNGNSGSNSDISEDDKQ